MKTKRILLLSLTILVLGFWLKSAELDSSYYQNNLVAQSQVSEMTININTDEIMNEFSDSSLVACGDGCDPETECCHYCQVNACLYRS